MTLNEEWNMTYDEYVQHLLDKYGVALDDYFCTKECRSKNRKVSRTIEGLECHHIDEDKYIHLSTKEFARNHWESQKAERLVYADLIEHLLLHIKITRENCIEVNPNADPNSERANFGFDSGCLYLIGVINTMFQFKPEIAWKADLFEKIEPRFDDYIEILSMLHIYYNVPFEILFTGDVNAKYPCRPQKVIDAVLRRMNSSPKCHFIRSENNG